MRQRGPEARTRALVAAAVLLATGCPAPSQTGNVNDGHLSKSAAPAIAPVLAPAGAVRVLFHEDWFGSVQLIGVDAGHTRALLRLAGQNPARLYVDTIDLTNGTRAERWDIPEGPSMKAIGGDGFPTADVLRAETMRFASLVAALGPWHMRPALASPTFATTADRSLVLFGSPPNDGSSGDWLLALGKDGSPPQRIDEGVIASYSPVISPNGKTVAFRACASSPCDYGLFLSNVGDKPHRVQGITGSTPPVFDKDGSHVFAIGDGLHRSRCLFKAPVATKSKAESLFCMRGVTDVAFTEDREGRTGVVSGVKGTPGKQSVEFVWVLLENGNVLQEQTVDRATGGGILNGAGLLALPMQKGGVAIVDLIGQKSVTLPEEESWFFAFDTAGFSDTSLVLLRKPEGARGYEIVSIDARGLVDSLGKGPGPAPDLHDKGFIPPSP